MANLMYFINDAYLVGDINGQHFQIKAVSGGRAGSTRSRVVLKAVANNPYRTGQQEDDKKGIVGGPLPCGLYTLRVDPTRRGKHTHKIIKWIKLIPDPNNFTTKRSDFAIHGHGAEGSHGCIVPELAADLDRLYAAVKAYAGTAPVTLSVVAGELPDRV